MPVSCFDDTEGTIHSEKNGVFMEKNKLLSGVCLIFLILASNVQAHKNKARMSNEVTSQNTEHISRRSFRKKETSEDVLLTY